MLLNSLTLKDRTNPVKGAYLLHLGAGVLENESMIKRAYLLHLGAGVLEPLQHGEDLFDGHVGGRGVVVDLLEVAVGLVFHLGSRPWHQHGHRY